MQRAPMGGCVIGLIGAVSYGAIYRHKLVMILKVSLAAIIAGIVIVTVLRKMNPEQFEYLQYKIESITEDKNDFINDRYNIDYMDVRESWLGDGAGRHSPWASKYNSTNMSDGQYKKIQQEQGDIGLSLYILFFALLALKCLTNIKNLSFELSLMIFLFFSMIGANPLSNLGIHGPIVFIIMGHISSFKKIRKNRYRDMSNTELQTISAGYGNQ